MVRAFKFVFLFIKDVRSEELGLTEGLVNGDYVVFFIIERFLTEDFI